MSNSPNPPPPPPPHEFPTEKLIWKKLDDLTEEYNRQREVYNATLLAQQIRNFVRGREWNVTNALAIGFGSFSCDFTAVDCLASLYQLIVFMDVIKHLPNSEDIKVYARQGSLYRLDMEFLASIGIHVVDLTMRIQSEDCGPVADLIGPHTFLFMYNILDSHVLMIISECKPELYIGWISTYSLEQMKWPKERLEQHHFWSEALVDQDEYFRRLIPMQRKAAAAGEKYLKDVTYEVFLQKTGDFDPCPQTFRRLAAYYEEKIVSPVDVQGGVDLLPSSE